MSQNEELRVEKKEGQRDGEREGEDVVVDVVTDAIGMDSNAGDALETEEKENNLTAHTAPIAIVSVKASTIRT